MPDLFRASDLAQAWPWSHPNQIGPSHGFGSERGYRPDWRKRNQDGYAFFGCQLLGIYSAAVNP